MSSASLEAQAERFAEDLTETVSDVVPGIAAFAATSLSSDAGERFLVRQSPNTGIALRVGDEPLLTLTVEYRCRLDGHDRYLAVDESSIKVFAGSRAAGEPLFRFEYVRSTHDGVPAAHLHVHAHRDALTYVMARCGDSTGRARRRQQTAQVPRSDELHFPLGGHRFRPCLEDVLEMLITELGVDHPDAARAALRAGRESWRRTQTRSVVRDAPSEAIAALEDLGYEVSFKGLGSNQPENVARLQDY
ncbi:hypothetical protein [Sinomonas sp. ASV322]|uniref:hypothetical protein n=1 Tax=Sinomonas sp. ASV322 TaxID=3041920 RepID=UPI0027DD83F4|nr:hypothetical protein [Sinomonas sp. ASV322]MDQ4501516.1 hypothetical protein [Sinomonas sp. ASV322]